MLRSQFECFIRGVWIFYSASEVQLSKLTAELNIQNIKRSEKLLTLSGMTDELKLSTPPSAVNPILKFGLPIL